MNFLNPELQLQNTQFAIKNKLNNFLKELISCYNLGLKIEKNKIINENETKYSTFYSNSKAETIIHDADINSILESIDSTIMTKIQKYHAEGSGWTIGSVIEQNINISKYKPLSGSSYIKLPKELNHSRKALIGI